MQKCIILFLSIVLLVACTETNREEKTLKNKTIIITEQIVDEVSDNLIAKHGNEHTFIIKKSIHHIASLWRIEDGSVNDFKTFCIENYLADKQKRLLLFQKASKIFESIYGHFNEITIALRENTDLDNGPILPVDEIISGYSVSGHLQDDLYNNKVAFMVALNFPYFSLEEKEKLGKEWTREEWAFARMGDIFMARVPATVNLNLSKVNGEAEVYISGYSICMDKLRTENGKQIFPDSMTLLSHWNLRDEIKSCYAETETGKEKQEMIYQVMQRIIKQEIPDNVIKNRAVEWQPYSNKVFENGKEIKANAEANVRYQNILNWFHAEQEKDAYYTELNTYIKRKFSGEMEIAQAEVETLFHEYLKSPQLAEIGKIIQQRLGRDLRPYDIWYDGFKTRSTYAPEMLDSKVKSKYPNAAALQAGLSDILIKLGWNKERAAYLANKIQVDGARGAGHAWEAMMKGEKAHLRTRISPVSGMDYKGFNIAIHEFGHNVEQVISLYDVDYYMMKSIPNPSFTEALAFIFQSRDLQVLGFNKQESPIQETLQTFDAAWTLMEIMGAGMVDMKTWKWLYEHPKATAKELNTAVNTIAKDVWNEYYAPIFGEKDQVLLGIYSHMVSFPLYLAAYSYGHIIEFQIEEYLQGKSFANEVDRMYSLGKLTPQYWMERATGSKISIQPILNRVDKMLPK